jgi:hypothetical protein
MGTRNPLAYNPISFYDIAVNGGFNLMANINMHDIRYNYPDVNNSNPDGLDEFFGSCACEIYELTNDDENYDRIYSYQGCDGIWLINESLGPNSTIAIEAIWNTVSTGGAGISDVGVGCL